jgi:CDP-4-dehydro-6-deoxyglucose reductase
MDRLSADVIGLVMAPAANARFCYRPGQYLSVVLADGQRRSFSMASACGVDRPIELHVRRRPGGCFSDIVLAGLKVGDPLVFEGPFGHVDWREGMGPVILMGTGTGLAPLKALLEQGLVVGGQREIHLYWGGRAPADLYLSAHLHHLARDHARLRFIPILSRPHAGWVGRRGYVQDAVAEDFPNLHDADVYACGSGTMINAARARLGDLPGFDEERFQVDAFERHHADRLDVVTAAPSTFSSDLPSVGLSVNIRGTVRSVRACRGATLLSALQVAGVPIRSVCGGKASCGTCKITVAPAWRERLPNPGRSEQRLLANLDDTGPCDRLACQIYLTRQTEGLAINLVCEATAEWPA